MCFFSFPGLFWLSVIQQEASTPIVHESVTMIADKLSKNLST